MVARLMKPIRVWRSLQIGMHQPVGTPTHSGQLAQTTSTHMGLQILQDRCQGPSRSQPTRSGLAKLVMTRRRRPNGAAFSLAACRLRRTAM